MPLSRRSKTFHVTWVLMAPNSWSSPVGTPRRRRLNATGHDCFKILQFEHRSPVGVSRPQFGSPMTFEAARHATTSFTDRAHKREPKEPCTTRAKGTLLQLPWRAIRMRRGLVSPRLRCTGLSIEAVVIIGCRSSAQRRSVNPSQLRDLPTSHEIATFGGCLRQCSPDELSILSWWSTLASDSPNIISKDRPLSTFRCDCSRAICFDWGMTPT